MAYSDSIVSSIMGANDNLKLDNSIFSSNDFEGLRNGINNVSTNINAAMAGIENSLTDFTNLNKQLDEKETGKRLNEKQKRERKNLSDEADRKTDEAMKLLGIEPTGQSNNENANTQQSNDNKEQTNTQQPIQQQFINQTANGLQQDLISNQQEQPLNQSFSQDNNDIITGKTIATDKVVEREINEATNGLGADRLKNTIDTKIKSKLGNSNFSTEQARFYLKYPNALERDKGILEEVFKTNDIYNKLKEMIFDDDLRKVLLVEDEVNNLRQYVKDGTLPYSYNLKIAQEMKDENPYKYRDKNVNELAMEISKPNDTLTGRLGKDGYKTQEQLDYEKQQREFKQGVTGNALRNGQTPLKEDEKTPKPATTPQAVASNIPTTSANNVAQNFKDAKDEANAIASERGYVAENLTDPKNAYEINDSYQKFGNSLAPNSGLKKTTYYKYKEDAEEALRETDPLARNYKDVSHLYPGYNHANSVFGRVMRNHSTITNKLIDLQKNIETSLVRTGDGGLSSNSIEVLRDMDMEELEELKGKLEKIVSGKDLRGSDGKNVLQPQDVEDAEIALGVINSTIEAKKSLIREVNADPRMAAAKNFVNTDYEAKYKRLMELKQQQDEYFAKYGNDAKAIPEYIKLNQEIETLSSQIKDEEIKNINAQLGVPLDTPLKENYGLHFIGNIGSVNQMYIDGEKVTFGADVPNGGSALAIWAIQSVFEKSKYTEKVIDAIKNNKLGGDAGKALAKLEAYMKQKEIKREKLTDILEDFLVGLDKIEGLEGVTFQPRKHNGLLDETQNSPKSTSLKDGISWFVGNVEQVFRDIKKEPLFFSDKSKLDEKIMSTTSVMESTKNFAAKNTEKNVYDEKIAKAQEKEKADKKAINK